jgi:hypothetical protein
MPGFDGVDRLAGQPAAPGQLLLAEAGGLTSAADTVLDR